MRMRTSRRLLAVLAVLFLTGAILLVLNPFLRSGVLALLNRLFVASETRNAYEYDLFADADERAAAFALAVTATALLSLFLMLVILNRRAAGLMLFAAPALIQAYFGLAAPAYVNVAVFTAAALLELTQIRQGMVYLLAGTIIMSLVVTLFCPGVHAGTEKRSEQVRDWLGRAAEGEMADSEDGISERMETRHTNEKSIDYGEKEARGTEGYRVVQIEKMQISRPDWINLLKTALLMLGSMLLLILPFVPFAVINMRRNHALKQQAAFEAEDSSAAVRAMFRHVIRYLCVSGMEEKNVPYSAWKLPDMQEEYQSLYRACAGIWERAAYSDHPADDDCRAKVKVLLDETERLLYDDADWKQRFRLRVVECLHE